MGKLDLETRTQLEKYIDRYLITGTSRVRCLWDNQGQYVDLDYDYDPENEIVNNYSCVFAELYEDGSPDKNSWRDARDIGEYLSNIMGLPLIIERTRYS